MELEPDQWVDEYGSSLFKYAMLRLGDRESAENVVQETFLAALVGRSRFKGDSSPLTWLTGILKYKIVDHIRQKQREGSISEGSFDDLAFENLFDKRGQWIVSPSLWKSGPSETFEMAEFWAVFQRCLDGIPRNLSQVFILKELEGMGSKEICKVLEITPTNLWVKLHRTREKLRKCLTVNWFDR